MDSFISWIGGKKSLRNAICERFPLSETEKYVEVFGGAAWVLFHKEKHANLEVYNDINSNLVNLFKCVKYHPNAINEELENTLNAREIYDNCKSLYNCEALTDIQRAAKYFYMIKASFGSKVSNFGAKARDVSNAEYLEAFKARLKKVVIENKSFQSLIKQYDRPNTLFYCDPPYFGTERYYDTGDIPFTKEMHEELAEILRNIRGKVIVSYNNDDYIKKLYHGFNIEEISRQNNLSRNTGQSQYKELLIRNY
ncbi:MAG: DNA adenine methylase [Defluviitaleaceae bacterium]|nr:DNA adenine methylase [Defluviitaleaceae bacterium]MCL2264312.1 DNA adenine methylase [Defluviitaleaceae bacterium]